jgi:hypothetical protein
MDTRTDMERARDHLHDALAHKFGPTRSAAEPLIRAIAEYGQKCREHDETGMAAASTHVYEALTHHFGPLDLGASQPLVKALAEYGKACREAAAAK